MKEIPTQTTFITWLREASPYMLAHRGHTFVVYLAGEACADPEFSHLVEDLVLLAGVGVKLIVVHGTRPQVAARLAAAAIESRIVGNLRVTDAQTMVHVKDAAAGVRFAIESQFAHATRVRPLGGGVLRIVGGNYVMARPAGIIDGVDLQFTGEIRRIDGRALDAHLGLADVVLISPLGYSPTGETFSLNALDLATEIAIELKATKLILMTHSSGIKDADGHLLRQLTPREARDLPRRPGSEGQLLGCAVRACQYGVGRVHVVEAADGKLLLELFTRDGVGTLVSNAPFDQLRQATIEDVGGLLALIEPLEAEGVLVKRSREKLENEIEHFLVMVRDGAAVACGALYPYAPESTGEIAGIAVDPQYRRQGFGHELIAALERRARDLGLSSVFVLTTHATHWFQEHGFERAGLDCLPASRQALYNFQRNSQVLRKRFGADG
jgi:amino-acid N-acetyltransferase